MGDKVCDCRSGSVASGSSLNAILCNTGNSVGDGFKCGPGVANTDLSKMCENGDATGDVGTSVNTCGNGGLVDFVVESACAFGPNADFLTVTCAAVGGNVE